MVYNNNMHTSASLKLVYQNALAWPKKFAPEVETHFTLLRTIRVECNFFSSFLIRNRGAHFQNNLVGLSWPIHILNNFSRGFQKYNCFQDWTHPVDAQPLPCLPAQFWWATRLGRACASIGCVQSWKNYIFGILMRNCTKYLSASSIRRNSF